ncbi:MAG: hypothetical protein ACRDGF_08275 [Chloroflexota bacterium]
MARLGSTRGERRETRRRKRQHGMRVSGASIRRIQLALIDRAQRKGKASRAGRPSRRQV